MAVHAVPCEATTPLLLAHTCSFSIQFFRTFVTELEAALIQLLTIWYVFK